MRRSFKGASPRALLARAGGSRVVFLRSFAGAGLLVVAQSFSKGEIKLSECIALVAAIVGGMYGAIAGLNSKRQLDLTLEQMRLGNDLSERAYAQAQLQIALQREALDLQRRQGDPQTAASPGEGVGSA